jgi:hypothetical protein
VTVTDQRVRPPLHVSRLFSATQQRAKVERFFRAAGCDVAVEPWARAKGFSLATSEAMSSPHAKPPALGYVLQCDEKGVALLAADEAGFYAGLQTLWQMLTCGHSLPCCVVSDWPAVKTRSFQIDLARQPETASEVQRLLRQQARYHFNECQLYLETCIKLPAFGEGADPEGLTPDEFQELQGLGRDLGVDVVPSLNLLGHMEKLLRHPQFAALSETTHGARHPEQAGTNCICPELPETKALIGAVIAEMCALSRSPKLMVGLDECWSLGSHPLTRARLDSSGGAGPVFRDWIRFLHAEVTRHGKQMWMWEDMLFYHLGARGHIPSDIGMNVWHYQHIEEYPHYSFQNWRRIDSVGTLARDGHPIMLCCGPALHHLHSMWRFAQGRPLEGILVVQWEGSGIVQELCHLDRALAAGLLWSGALPSFADAARGLTGRDGAEAVALGDQIAHVISRPSTKGGGSHTCPRFWSWPENAAALPTMRALVATWRRWSAGHEPSEVVQLFLDLECVQVAADWARETAALTGRQMLQCGLRSSPVLDDAVLQLENAARLAVGLPARARAIHDRYTAGLKERWMVSSFVRTAEETADLIARLKRFQTDPSRQTWPFAAVSLHVDVLVLDPCAHHVVLKVKGAEDSEWQPVYDGGARLPATLEGEFVMSFPLAQAPSLVRLSVGGFASLGIMRVRVETLDGTRLARRVVESGGCCRDPQHLLEFDRKIAVFNPPDVLPNWLSFERPAENFVVLEF